MDKRQSYIAFMILYWTGIRSGELLALTIADFNLEDIKNLHKGQVVYKKAVIERTESGSAFEFKKLIMKRLLGFPNIKNR